MYLINDTLSESLPVRFFLPGGSTRTSLHDLSESELAELGIYYCDVVKPPKSWTQYYGDPVIEIANNRATATYPVLDYTQEEVDRILEEAKEKKRNEIAAARWDEMSTPTTVDNYDAVWYADKESMNDMLRASIDMQTAVDLGYLPIEETNVSWKTAEGTFVTLNLTDLVTIRLLLSQRQQSLYAKEAMLLNQINSATTPDEVSLIVWNEPVEEPPSEPPV